MLPNLEKTRGKFYITETKQQPIKKRIVGKYVKPDSFEKQIRALPSLNSKLKEWGIIK